MGKRTSNRKPRRPQEARSSSRHERDCKVCGHPQRAEIERAWISWGDTTEIAKTYELSRDSIYRHAHALGLFEKRSRNVRAALEKIIEKAGSVEVTAPAVVSAVQAYAKINAQGQWVERIERVDMREVFDRMTREELDTYARTGELPAWTGEFAAATRFESGGESENG